MLNGHIMNKLSGEMISADRAGLIRSNLVERLCKENKILVVDTLMTGSEENLVEARKSGNVTFKKDDSNNIYMNSFKASVSLDEGIGKLVRE